MNRKKTLIKVVAYILLIVVTFGIAIIGINLSPTYDVRYKGFDYKETSLNTFTNKLNQHIYVSFNEDYSDITITIEGENVVISILDRYSEYSIKDNDIVYNGVLNEEDDSELANAYKDYLDLMYSYRDHTLIMDEYPEIIIFPLLAIPPFFFGLILLLDLLKKRVKKVSTFHLIFRGLNSIIFVFFLFIEFLVIWRHI